MNGWLGRLMLIFVFIVVMIPRVFGYSAWSLFFALFLGTILRVYVSDH